MINQLRNILDKQAAKRKAVSAAKSIVRRVTGSKKVSPKAATREHGFETKKDYDLFHGLMSGKGLPSGYKGASYIGGLIRKNEKASFIIKRHLAKAKPIGEKVMPKTALEKFAQNLKPPKNIQQMGRDVGMQAQKAQERQNRASVRPNPIIAQIAGTGSPVPLPQETFNPAHIRRVMR